MSECVLGDKILCQTAQINHLVQKQCPKVILKTKNSSVHWSKRHLLLEREQMFLLILGQENKKLVGV